MVDGKWRSTIVVNWNFELPNGSRFTDAVFHTLLTLAVATLGLISLITFAYVFKFIDIKDIATSALALVGTFLGATFAFRLNETKEHDSLHAKRRESLNRAIFILIRQFNAVHLLKLEIEKHSNTYQKAFNMQAITPPPYHDLYHNFETLEFILESSEPGLIFELTAAQEGFHQTLSALKFRNDFFINEVMPAVANTDLNRRTVSLEEVRGILGDRLYFGAIQGVDGAEKMLVLSNENLQKMLNTVVNFAKQSYPKHKFINYQIQA